MKTFASLFLTLTAFASFTTSALAAPFTNWVVKTYSFHQDAKQVEFRGSGTLFQYLGKNYVLSSEHVFLHLKKENRIHIENIAIGKQSAELVTADFATGLAILEVKTKISITPPSLDTLFASQVTDQEAITVAGFPFDFTTPVEDPHGYIYSSKSNRHFIPLLPSMIETMGAQGEYGMSGGSAWAANKMVGVISHQVLVDQEGGKPAIQVVEANENHAKYNHLLLIPSSFIKNWLVNSVFAPHACVNAVRVARQQLRMQNVIRTQNFVMKELSADEIKNAVGGADGHGIGGADGHGIGGADGHGIGGADGHGIGGADGHGIGGADDPVSTVTAGGIGIEDADRSTLVNTPNEWNFCSDGVVKTALGETKNFKEVVSLEMKNSSLKVVNTQTVDHALSSILRGHAIAVPLHASDEVSKISIPEVFKASDALASLQQVWLSSKKPPPVAASSLVSNLRGMMDLLKTNAGQQALKQLGVLSQTLKNESAWNSFFAEDFDTATLTYAVLEKANAL